MEKNNYQQIQRAARRSRLNLSASIVYLVIFILGILVIASRLVPVYQYRYFNDDKIIFKEGERPPYLNVSYADDHSYSRLELYRQDWYDLSQNNLIMTDFNSNITFPPFGREESFQVYKRIGYKYYPTIEVTNTYLFNTLTSSTSETNSSMETESMIFPLNYVGELAISPSYDKLIEFLKVKGEFKVANVKVSFKLPTTRENIKPLFEKSDVELLRYGVDYPESNDFGYPAYVILNFNEKYELSEDDFLRKLKNVTRDYEKYGNQLPGRQTKSPLDFSDTEEFITFNGIKYSNLLLTGTADQLADWLTEHRDLILQIDIQELTDWNKILIGRNEGNDYD